MDTPARSRHTWRTSDYVALWLTGFVTCAIAHSVAIDVLATDSGRTLQDDRTLWNDALLAVCAAAIGAASAFAIARGLRATTAAAVWCSSWFAFSSWYLLLAYVFFNVGD